jgi:hypothetical protein
MDDNSSSTCCSSDNDVIAKMIEAPEKSKKANEQTEPSMSNNGSSSQEEAVNSGSTAVSWSRALMFLVLAGSAILLGWLTYFFVHYEEEEDFRVEVSLFSNASFAVLGGSEKLCPIGLEIYEMPGTYR